MAKLGELPCQACGVGVHAIMEGKGGTLSGTCSNSGCRSQLLIKSPAGVMALRQRLAPASVDPGGTAGRSDPAKAEGSQAAGGKRAGDWLGKL